MSNCGCSQKAPSPRFLVQERDSAYAFVVVEDLGVDAQSTGGHWYKDVAHFTYKPWAEDVVKQLNTYGHMYFPGCRIQDKPEFLQ